MTSSTSFFAPGCIMKFQVPCLTTVFMTDTILQHKSSGNPDPWTNHLCLGGLGGQRKIHECTLNCAWFLAPHNASLINHWDPCFLREPEQQTSYRSSRHTDYILANLGLLIGDIATLVLSLRCNVGSTRTVSRFGFIKMRGLIKPWVSGWVYWLCFPLGF